MDAMSGKRVFAIRAPSLVAVVLLVVLLAVPVPAKAGRALSIFGGAVLLTSLLHAITYHPPRVVYQSAPVVYYPQRVVYQTAPVVYYPQPVVYQTVVTRY